MEELGDNLDVGGKEEDQVSERERAWRDSGRCGVREKLDIGNTWNT